MKQCYIIGWDIGGAHNKAAVINMQGEIIDVQQQPCPLWKGLAELSKAVENILHSVHIKVDLHILTMTGELVDLFENRADGVKQIITTMQACLSGQRILIYAGKQGFIKPEHVNPQKIDFIASANWLASASYAAHSISAGLFVDIGSTTTDILIVGENKVLTNNYTDYQRLCSEELVYTGIVRTAVMAVTDETVFQGQRVGLMAEYFATMADVYRITEELQVYHDQYETADGAEKSISASCKRLARMIGCDYHTDQVTDWRQVAENIREHQLLKIQRGCELQISRNLLTRQVIVGAGIGRFLVKKLASRLGLSYVDFADLVDYPLNQYAIDVADCAPAVSVAKLYQYSNPDWNG